MAKVTGACFMTTRNSNILRLVERLAGPWYGSNLVKPYKQLTHGAGAKLLPEPKLSLKINWNFGNKL